MITCLHNNAEREYTIQKGEDVIFIPYSMVETANPVSLLWAELVNDMETVGDVRQCEDTLRNALRFYNLQLAMDRVRVRVRQPKTRQLMERSVFA